MPAEQPVEAIAEDCPCVQTHCPIHGHCVACVRGHRNGSHIPECMQDQLRGIIADLASHVEMKTREARPGSGA